MDERLRKLLREAAADPTRWPRVAVERARSGQLVAVAALVRDALGRGESAPDDLLDALTPHSLGALVPRALTRHVDAAKPVQVAGWFPDEDALLLLGEGLRREELRRLDAASERALLRRGDVATGNDDYELGAAALDPVGSALVFSVRSSLGQRWFRRDLQPAVTRRGPMAGGTTPRVWWGRDVIGAEDSNWSSKVQTVFVWRDGAEKAELLAQGDDVAVSEGTCLALEKKVLGWHRPGVKEPVASIPFPIKYKRGKWAGLVAAWGGRALICQRDGQPSLSLLDARRELARAPIPADDGKLVGVRPCPSGRVVALRYKDRKQVTLVDLRDGGTARVDLPEIPRDLLWSPSGQALAAPGRRGGVLVLGAALPS